MVKEGEEKRGERTAFLSLLFSTERPAWVKDGGTSLFVFNP